MKSKNDYEKLCGKVADWSVLYSGLKYFCFYNYYPTTCTFSASQAEWNVRTLIWGFKYSDTKRISKPEKDAANYQVASILIKKIRDTFDGDLSKLTLVCIPASSKVVNRMRYEKFSNVICQLLGMENAYPYIEILTDREAKHSGGTSEPDLYFDPAFFKGKNIIIFDDVITKGDSMTKMCQKMQELGGDVICGISIGKTKHERD